MRSISELEQKLVAGGGYEESLVSPSTISNGYGGNGWGEGGGAWGAMSGATQSMSVATVTVTGTRMTAEEKAAYDRQQQHNTMVLQGVALIGIGALAVATGGFSLVAVGTMAVAGGSLWAGVGMAP